jgi:hypothetical protein
VTEAADTRRAVRGELKEARRKLYAAIQKIDCLMRAGGEVDLATAAKAFLEAAQGLPGA